MPRRKKKHEPEMLIVSFCDIVTITTAAMFFAMLITTQEAVKIPVFRPVVRTRPTDKQAVFFEYRNNEVFYIDKGDLDARLEKYLATLPRDDPRRLAAPPPGTEIGNEFYTLIPQYLAHAVMALQPRPGVHGVTAAQMDDPTSQFQRVLTGLNPKLHFIDFLVRDDSFVAFRAARVSADRLGFDVGWEFYAETDVLQFGAHGKRPGTGG
jgi:hypothetical protein